MSALAPAPPRPLPADAAAEPRAASFLTGLLVLSRRSLTLSFRDPESVLMAVLLPVMIWLSLWYVRGGAMSVGDGAPSHGEYLAYVLPAIALTAAGFGASFTEAGGRTDMTHGLLERLRTTPFPAVTAPAGPSVAATRRIAGGGE